MVEYKDLIGFAKEFVDYSLLFVYFVFGIALVTVLAFPAIQLFRNFKKALTALAGVTGLVAIYFLCYMLAKPEPFVSGDISVSAMTMKFVEANIFMTYIVFAISILAIIYSFVASYFK